MANQQNNDILPDNSAVVFVEDTELGRLVLRTDWNRVSERLATRVGRGEARMPSRNGGFLCHQESFLSAAPGHCINALGNAYPAGWLTVYIRDIKKEYPLHIASKIRNPVDPLLVSHVYQLAPSCIKKGNHHGETPLHVACEYDNTQGAKWLFHKWRNAAFETSKYGDYPLHLACEFAMDECIPLLTRANPQAAGISVGRDRLPLQLALFNRSFIDPLPSLHALIDAYPAALIDRCQLQEHPLELAAANLNEEPKVIQLILSNLERSPWLSHRIQSACFTLLSSLSHESDVDCLKMLLDHDCSAPESSLSNSKFEGLEWAPWDRINHDLGDFLFHVWLKYSHALLVLKSLFDEEEYFDGDDADLMKMWKCREWEGVILERLVDPYPDCMKMPSGSGAYPLALMDTESYFIYNSTFQRLIRADGGKMFQPHKCELFFEDSILREDSTVPITPVARILCRIAELCESTTPRYEVFKFLHQLQDLSLALRMQTETSVFSTSNETKFNPAEVAHMVCYFCAGLHPDDFERLLRSSIFIHIGGILCLNPPKVCLLTGLDLGGDSSLHYLCGAYVSPFLKDDVKLLPVKTEHRDGSNDEKLHLSAYCDVLRDCEGGESLLKEASRVKNKRGELPLHLAVKRRSNTHQKERDVDLLVKLYPESVFEVDAFAGGLYPFMLAALKSSRPSITCTFVLLQKFVASRDLHDCKNDCCRLTESLCCVSKSLHRGKREQESSSSCSDDVDMPLKK